MQSLSVASQAAVRKAPFVIILFDCNTIRMWLAAANATSGAVRPRYVGGGCCS